MIQIISFQWYRNLEKKFGKGVAGGAFYGTCVGFASKEEKEEYFGVLKQDEERGMTYGK